jgi:PKD repeat protein
MGSGVSPTHVYSQVGTYTVFLTVYDDDGAADIDTMTVTVSNVPPTADAGADQTVNEDQLVFFGGSGTDTPSDEPLLSYEWDFGDGTTGNGKNPIHAYQDEGTYDVTLTVTDDDGGLGQDIMQVTVANIGPVVDCGPDVEVNEDVPVQFMGYAFDTPSDEQSLLYSWDFGDGNSGMGINPAHSYSNEGIYTVTLTVTDDNSFIGTDSMTVTVKNIPPTVVATFTAPCSVIIAGDVLTFDCVVYDSPSDLSTITYHWDFGDGTTATGATATHAYAVEGIYLVTLTVTDDDDATGQDILIVIVERHTMEMEITSLVDEVMPGETAEYVLTIRNTGTIDDSCSLVVDSTLPNDVWMEFDRMHVSVEANSESQIIVLMSPQGTLPLDRGITLGFEVSITCTHKAAEVSNAPLIATASDNLTILATYESRLRWAQVEIEGLITDFSGGNPTDATLLKALEEVSEALFFSYR